MTRGIDLSGPPEPAPPPLLDRSRVTVIAEIGSCHDNSLDQALRLLDAAKSCGADFAKAQYWSSGTRLARRRNAPELAAAYDAYTIPRDWLGVLSEHAKTIGIGFACTSYIPEDVWAVADVCQVLKIASFEANDPELLTCHREPYRLGRHVIVSLGMGARADVAADHLLRGNGSNAYEPRLHFLHCVSAYPAPVNQFVLRRLWSRTWEPSKIHGLSDHSDPNNEVMGALAVAAGARIVERHIRLVDTKAENPDRPHSMIPRTFAEYVRLIRLAEQALGSEEDATVHGDAQSCEEPMLRYRVTRTEG